MTLTHSITFSPAYDHRAEGPGNAGQHPMHINFLLKGPKGALHFDVNTAWYIDQEQHPTRSYVWGLTAHRYIDSNPHADASDITDDCGWLGHEPCIAEQLESGIGEVPKGLWLIFLRKGEAGLWPLLEAIYLARM